MTALRCNEMCSHLERLNGSVSKHEQRICEAERTLLVMNTEKATELRLSKKQVLGWGSAFVALVTVMLVVVEKLLEGIL